jgi:phenylpropionate dioxygenase-like ring-hydroxylating dioxygenase large terminal subunit
MRIEDFVWNEWYPVAVLEDLQPGVVYQTRLLGEEVAYRRSDGGRFSAWRCNTEQTPCSTYTRFHTLWVTLGKPNRPFFDIPEFAEPGRRVVGLGSMQLHVSGLRVVENFLDMAHFPYVHGGLLGEEPHTDVKDYQVVWDAERDEIFANNCTFYQPLGAASASGGMEAEYVYRVMRPFSTILYKTSASDPVRRDVICLFVQPLNQEWCVGHFVLAAIDHVNSDHELRLFQQTIVGQDLMILSNHVPRTLPLGQKLEVPTRADAMSAAYRRWLRDKGVRYGTYQAA